MSVTTEHWTPEIRNLYAVRYANGVLRNQMGMRIGTMSSLPGLLVGGLRSSEGPRRTFAQRGHGPYRSSILGKIGQVAEIPDDSNCTTTAHSDDTSRCSALSSTPPRGAHQEALCRSA